MPLPDKLKYPFVYAWDRMLGSYEEWSEREQERAEKESAPLDAVYRDSDGKWVSFKNVQSFRTKRRIWNWLNTHGYSDEAGPRPESKDFPLVVTMIITGSRGGLGIGEEVRIDLSEYRNLEYEVERIRLMNEIIKAVKNIEPDDGGADFVLGEPDRD